MHMHPHPDHHDHRYDTQGPATSGPETHMFERDDLFLRERLADLRATATAVHPLADTPSVSVLDRTRQTIGRSLIAVGTVVAGAGLDLRDRASEARPDRDRGLVA